MRHKPRPGLTMRGDLLAAAVLFALVAIVIWLVAPWCVNRPSEGNDPTNFIEEFRVGSKTGPRLVLYAPDRSRGIHARGDILFDREVNGQFPQCIGSAEKHLGLMIVTTFCASSLLTLGTLGL